MRLRPAGSSIGSLERIPERVRQHDIRLLDAGGRLAVVGDVQVDRQGEAAEELDLERGLGEQAVVLDPVEPGLDRLATRSRGAEDVSQV